MILECLSPVYDYHGNFLVKPGIRSAVFENIDFPKGEGLRGLQSAELRFDRVAQAAPGLGEEYDFYHLV
ncbi:MAG: hypothetical protein ABSG32_24445 [Terriglobia bacterium]|jgi:hypothetical protein